jgi:NADPH-dependent glutamate synthase beta subunit-like oxidoreductase
MSAKFAIVGAGPAGMYAADALLKSFDGCNIDVFEKYPAPFGLIRYGVAPDHYKTRNTSRQFARTLDEPQVGYYGNVDIGTDITMDELKANYDGVVLAMGAYNDRKLGIPGEDLPGVYGACAFVGWYNGHPEFRDLDPLLDKGGVSVIGIGNVALDVCRVLAKTREEMVGSDICAHALDAIEAAPITDLHMFGRRGPIEAGFTPKELGEIRDLERCAAIVDPAQLPDEVTGDFEGRTAGIKEKNLNHLKELAAQNKPEKPVKMNLTFYASPMEILGGDRVEALRLERTEVVDGRAVATGETFDVECGAVVTAIGYHTLPPEGVPLDGGTIANTNGHVADNVYVVGWAKRGPSGTIPTNGPDSRDVVDVMIKDISDGRKAGREAIDALIAERNVRRVNFNEWKIIGDAETNRAPEGHPRERFTRVDEMLALLD